MYGQIKAFLPDFSRTPNEVLKFMIVELIQENKYMEDVLYSLDMLKCDCGHWVRDYDLEKCRACLMYVCSADGEMCLCCGRIIHRTCPSSKCVYCDKVCHANCVDGHTINCLKREKSSRSSSPAPLDDSSSEELLSPIIDED